MALYKGVFWIAQDSLSQYVFKIPCDINGNIAGQTDYALNSKDGTNYNHRLLWAALPKALTHNKPFDYFPRGRVEIRNARAVVYLHPDINTEETQKFIIAAFALTQENGIIAVRFVADGSAHYTRRTEK